MVINKLKRLWIFVVELVVNIEEKEMIILLKNWIRGDCGCG